MTEKEPLKHVLNHTPALKILLEKYWNLSVYDYGKKFYESRRNSVRKNDFIEILREYLWGIFSQKSTIDRVMESLESNFCISSADHHGPIGHPFFFQSSILRWLVHAENTIVNLCTSHVSLGNSSYPRGFFVSSDTRENYQFWLPFFPAKDRMLPVFWHHAFQKENIKNCIYQLRKYEKEKYISPEKTNLIENWMQNRLLSDDILSKRTYSEQITAINDALWRDIFQGTLPDFISLDGEDIVRHILMNHLRENKSFWVFLTDAEMHKNIEAAYDGISCCFEKENKYGTYLFWYLDDAWNRHSLWRKDTVLISETCGVEIPLSKESLLWFLDQKNIIPSWLLMYSVLAWYYGLRCFGGFAQWTYLPKVLSAYEKVTGENVFDKESILCEDMIFSFTDVWSISTALDLLYSPELTEHEKLLADAKNTTLEESIVSMVPHIARCISF